MGGGVRSLVAFTALRGYERLAACEASTHSPLAGRRWRRGLILWRKVGSSDGDAYRSYVESKVKPAIHVRMTM